MAESLVLEARQITKRFPGVIANDQVSLQLHRSEIMALLGENGAGKSTLMNILYGLYHPDEGQILVHGQPVTLNNPREAIAQGIGMVHQHFQLVPVFTVAENVMLGAEVTGQANILNTAQAIKQVRALSEQYGLPIDPTAIVENLPVGMQQRVEIIKALYRQADILFLDEPTAVLTPQEVEELFTVMRGLTAQGKSIIFITHKLKEVLTIADRITVMRQGQVVGEIIPQEATSKSLAAMMVGRNVMLEVDKTPAQRGKPILSVQNLQVQDKRQQTVVADVSFEVHAGEILGVAGVQGNGQTELVEVLTGLRPITEGQIQINKLHLTRTNFQTISRSQTITRLLRLSMIPFFLELFVKAPSRLITQREVSHIPEDRQHHGLVLSYSVADNLVLNTYYSPPFTRYFSLQRKAIRDQALALIERFDIRTPSHTTNGGNLSGGNQQKMIVAREIGGRPVKLLIASQPTRGIDVGSIEFIYQQIIAQRDAGVAVLLISAELDEILSLSDRIAVMYEGQIVDIVDAATTSREQLGLLMAGSQRY